MASPKLVLSFRSNRELLQRVSRTLALNETFSLSAQLTNNDARRMRESIQQQIDDLGASPEFRMRYRDSMLAKILAAALAGTGATRGNIQLFDPSLGRLVLHAYQGFRPPFLEFFNHVECGSAACGAAFRSRSRQIVEDAANSAIFRGSQSLEILLDAGVRAVQSTPLFGNGRRIVGVLSTHYSVPHWPSLSELRSIDYFASRAAAIIDWYASSGRRA